MLSQRLNSTILLWYDRTHKTKFTLSDDVVPSKRGEEKRSSESSSLSDAGEPTSSVPFGFVDASLSAFVDISLCCFVDTLASSFAVAKVWVSEFSESARDENKMRDVNQKSPHYTKHNTQNFSYNVHIGTHRHRHTHTRTHAQKHTHRNTHTHTHTHTVA